MNRKLFTICMFVILLLPACGEVNTPMPILSIPPAKTDMPYNQEDVLFHQDFESGLMDGLVVDHGNWNIEKVDTGNHVLCNQSGNIFSVFRFGDPTWNDYTVEITLSPKSMQKDPYVVLHTRYDYESDNGYYGSLNFSGYYYDLASHYPYQSLGGGFYHTAPDNVYILKMETFRSRIRYYINGDLVGDKNDPQYTQGWGKFEVSPNLRVCVDDVLIVSKRLSSYVTSGTITAIPPNPGATATPTPDPRLKYETPFVFDFVASDGSLAPVRNSTGPGYFIPRPGDPRETITIDETFTVKPGENVLIENKIIEVKPEHRGDIEIFGTLTIRNSYIRWMQTEAGQTHLRIKAGGVIDVKDSYCFSANEYVAGWWYEDGSKVVFDHFVLQFWTAMGGSVNYTATNYSTVGLTLFQDTHDSTVRVVNAHYLALEINPTAGTHSITPPLQRQWGDFNLNDLWPNTTVEVVDSFIFDNAINVNDGVHLTVKDALGGFSFGWGVTKNAPPYITCELRELGQPGNELGIYIENRTWDLPCNNSSLTLINSVFTAVWPGPSGYVHLKVYDSNLIDPGTRTQTATLEIYDSTIDVVQAYDGSSIYVEDCLIRQEIYILGFGSRVYGYGVTGRYVVNAYDGGNYIELDEPKLPEIFYR